jgi:hypothetical protein
MLSMGLFLAGRNPRKARFPAEPEMRPEYAFDESGNCFCRKVCKIFVDFLRMVWYAVGMWWGG